MVMQLVPHFDRYDILYETEHAHIRAFHPKAPFFSFATFLAAYKDAPALGFEVDGQCVGGILVHRQEVHIGLLPQYHGVWSLLWPDCARWMYSISDPVYAMIMPSNKRILALVRHIGGKFVKNVYLPGVGSSLVYELRDSTTPYHLSAFERRRVRREQRLALTLADPPNLRVSV
jgi:hypothetical protein